jgi:hypothetical protein
VFTWAIQLSISSTYDNPLLVIFLIRIMGGGVQFGPLGTSANNWPIVPALGDYEDGEFGGMIIGRRNRSIRRKPAPVPICPSQIPHDLTGREPGPPGGKPASNSFSYGTASPLSKLDTIFK